MIETWLFSVQFFSCVLALSAGVFVLRTSPLFRRHGGLTAQPWSEWAALHLREKLDDLTESDLSRLVRLITLLTKYGVCVWGLLNFSLLTPSFWTLFWAVLLVLTLLRKVAQFQSPEKWEHVSLKLDAEHFWLIHLALLGMAEVQIPSGSPVALMALIGSYVVVNGESGPSLLASFEDVIRVSLGVLALWSLFQPQTMSLTVLFFFSMMAMFFIARGAVRAVLGRDWLRRRFWWVAQFCFLTSLILKALAVLDVLPRSIA